jgi:hypothetical protein
MPAITSSRSQRAHLQSLAGGLGEVDEYEHQSRTQREVPGWYWTPANATVGCVCRHCRSARAKAPSYLGFQSRDASVALAIYARDHANLAPDPLVTNASRGWITTPV